MTPATLSQPAFLVLRPIRTEPRDLAGLVRWLFEWGHKIGADIPGTLSLTHDRLAFRPDESFLPILQTDLYDPEADHAPSLEELRHGLSWSRPLAELDRVVVRDRLLVVSIDEEQVHFEVNDPEHWRRAVLGRGGIPDSASLSRTLESAPPPDSGLSRSQTDSETSHDAEGT